MLGQLSDTEFDAICERWEATEARYAEREQALRAMGELGEDSTITRPEGHHDIPLLLAALEALTTERDDLKRLLTTPPDVDLDRPTWLAIAKGIDVYIDTHNDDPDADNATVQGQALDELRAVIKGTGVTMRGVGLGALEVRWDGR